MFVLNEARERLEEAIAYLIGQRLVSTNLDIANKMTVHKSSVSSARNGNEKYLTPNFLKKFTETFPVISYSYLVNGNGRMLVSGSDVSQSSSKKNETSPELRSLINSITELVECNKILAQTNREQWLIISSNIYDQSEKAKTGEETFVGDPFQSNVVHEGNKDYSEESDGPEKPKGNGSKKDI